MVDVAGVVAVVVAGVAGVVAGVEAGVVFGVWACGETSLAAPGPVIEWVETPSGPVIACCTSSRATTYKDLTLKKYHAKNEDPRNIRRIMS